MDKDIEAIVLDALVEISGKSRESLTPETSLNDSHSIDSLEFVEVVMKIEEASGLKFPDTETASVKTVGEFLALCRRLQGEQGTAVTR